MFFFLFYTFCMCLSFFPMQNVSTYGPRVCTDGRTLLILQQSRLLPSQRKLRNCRLDKKKNICADSIHNRTKKSRHFTVSGRISIHSEHRMVSPSGNIFSFSDNSHCLPKLRGCRFGRILSHSCLRSSCSAVPDFFLTLVWKCLDCR